MPQEYAILDNGQGTGSKKPRSAKTKYVRQYLKKKGVAPTKDAASRSTRERKLRAKARAEFAATGKKKSGTGSKPKTMQPSTTPQKPKRGGFPSGRPSGIGKGY